MKKKKMDLQRTRVRAISSFAHSTAGFATAVRRDVRVGFGFLPLATEAYVLRRSLVNVIAMRTTPTI
jgi:hypothetical protein